MNAQLSDEEIEAWCDAALANAPPLDAAQLAVARRILTPEKPAPRASSEAA